MDSLLLVLFAYLLGSVLFGEHVARAKGIDIRAVGSGNVGATNVGRALGKKYAFIVFLLDMFKGLFPVILARFYYGLDSWTLAFVSLASVLGHMYPVFHSFRGGKGVATSFGVIMGISPKVGVLSLLLWLLVFKLKGYVSLASLSASLFAVFLLLVFKYPLKLLFVAFLIVLLIFYKHRENIKRLIEGKELSFK